MSQLSVVTNIWTHCQTSFLLLILFATPPSVTVSWCYYPHFVEEKIKFLYKFSFKIPIVILSSFQFC